MHTFRSVEREKIEIIAGLLQQAGYLISRIRAIDCQFMVTARLEGQTQMEGEHDRIKRIVQHFDIEEWIMNEEMD
ncbi:hypothetical protein M3591_07045 [Exiguobacterium sp. MER 193]|uniref:hypothetical protein n=1 Tax=Exiguobacterium sp. MER 193 TaxID=2939564 RepID=UPI00203BD25E|nr:hypothetical protein [Exiguobacterium sp. MER 193]MCM3280289.1 hypothetical protein [Exiguobacterium sp. MER 193]